jgi:hypothetical protein
VFFEYIEEIVALEDIDYLVVDDVEGGRWGTHIGTDYVLGSNLK